MRNAKLVVAALMVTSALQISGCTKNGAGAAGASARNNRQSTASRQTATPPKQPSSGAGLAKATGTGAKAPNGTDASGTTEPTVAAKPQSPNLATAATTGEIPSGTTEGPKSPNLATAATTGEIPSGTTEGPKSPNFATAVTTGEIPGGTTQSPRDATQTDPGPATGFTAGTSSDNVALASADAQ